jgi:hypothetical protein
MSTQFTYRSRFVEMNLMRPACGGFAPDCGRSPARAQGAPARLVAAGGKHPATRISAARRRNVAGGRRVCRQCVHARETMPFCLALTVPEGFGGLRVAIHVSANFGVQASRIGKGAGGSKPAGRASEA